jgi:hypothetical protein
MDQNNRIINSARAMIIGHLLIAFSGIAYAAAWTMLYSRLNFKSELSPIILINAALFLGTIGVFCLAGGIFTLSTRITGSRLRVWHIFVLSAILFCLAYFITGSLLDRGFTSELLIIFIWLSTEISALFVLYKTALLSRIQAGISFSLVAASVSAAIIGYVIHYRLEESARFINGLIPYLVMSAVMALISFFIFINKKH